MTLLQTTDLTVTFGGLHANNAVNISASRTTAPQIAGYIEDVSPYLDIDGNGVLDALTDGLMIIRYLFGISGNALINNAVAQDGSRTSVTDITNFLDTLK